MVNQESSNLYNSSLTQERVVGYLAKMLNAKDIDDVDYQIFGMHNSFFDRQYSFSAISAMLGLSIDEVLKRYGRIVKKIKAQINLQKETSQVQNGKTI